MIICVSNPNQRENMERVCI
ncbi:hypothetical protein Zm00014a_010217 [Zea mays]|uniref:Uncharacterized protein n=1 Tax=Zea mays TaxID=4577 RepID=A0A3L6G365_MAIZE|nr:hypothetical protein Zm00014a_010217 [Zea mays]